MGYTYPAPPVQVQGTTIEISEFLRNPNIIRRALQDITALGFISDYLLQGRYEIVGGSILYETGEEIFPNDAPESIAPGGEYPLTGFTQGSLVAARSTKWGRDGIVTDEAVTRYNFDPVQRALLKLGNGMIRQVDSVGLGVIGSKITQSFAASNTWTSDVDAIIEDVLTSSAQAEMDNLDFGDYSYDTVVLGPVQYAKVATKFLSSTLLPRENANNQVLSGVLENYLGKNWVTTKYAPFANPFIVDRSLLGGMADENLQSPGYSSTDSRSGAPGIEAKSIRDEARDQWRLRSRRVTVPIVRDPRAGFELTGTGL